MYTNKTTAARSGATEYTWSTERISAIKTNITCGVKAHSSDKTSKIDFDVSLSSYPICELIANNVRYANTNLNAGLSTTWNFW